MYYKSNKVILVFKGAYDRKITILVGFPYKNLGVTLAFADYERREQRRTNRLLYFKIFLNIEKKNYLLLSLNINLILLLYIY
jgi:hypothetical protein